MKRFAREAKAAAPIQSPNVVRTLDAGTDEQLRMPFIIMELMRGQDLAQLLKKVRLLEPQVAVRLFLQATHGIAAAHAQKVVHRDIKPANLFLQIEAGTGLVTVKVCDFGVAKNTQVDDYSQSSAALTRTGRMLGSPLYMSPEQARSAKHVDERTDVWSLSVALWEALAGERLWGDRGSLGELIIAICAEDIRHLEEVAPWVPPGLAKVVHRGLERDLAKRWPNMAAMAQALEMFTGGTWNVFEQSLVPMSEEQRDSLTKAASSRAAATQAAKNRSLAPRPQSRAAESNSGSSATIWVVILLAVAAVASAAFFAMR
jgi:eukaryotic-like serine/threonine-protein kinase